MSIGIRPYFDQRCQVCDVPLLPISLEPPQPDIIVSTCCGQPTLAVGLEMGGIDRRIIIMPGY